MKKWLYMLPLIFAAGAVGAENVQIASFLGDNWYGLYLNGEKAGYLLKRIEVENEDQVNVIEDAHFMISMSGVKQDMTIYSKRSYTLSGALRFIEMEMKDPAQLSTFHAVVRDDALVMLSVLGGATREETFALPNESLKDPLCHSLWVREKPSVGEIVRFSVFDPLFQKEISGISTISNITQRIFNGVSTRVYEIHTALDIMGIETTSYVTECGVVVEDLVAGVFIMRLEPEIAAKDVDYSVDTMVSNAVLVKAPIENARKRDALRLALNGPLREAHLFNDLRQTMSLTEQGAVFQAELTDLDILPTIELPIENNTLLLFTKPSTYVQSDEPRIIEKAQEIIGEERNARRIAHVLCDWVSANMRNVFSARLSNSLDALDSLEGDCTEHTVLFVGLARAVGLPAKKVAGLIYVEGGQPGFYFHQWASVWLGEWVDVDPAFNQLPVDVTHIKLAEGDLLRQIKILPLIGRLDIQVLPDRPDETMSEQTPVDSGDG